MALTGYASAAAGIVLYTLLERVVELKLGDTVLNVAVLISLAATLGGFVTAIVGSAIWARNTTSRQPLKIAAMIAVGSILLCLAVNVNVHGSSAMLIFLVPFCVVNVVSLLVVRYW